MYVILRVVQIAALVVFLWGNVNNNAEHLVGAGGPFLVWGSFAVMIFATYLANKEGQRRKGDTDDSVTIGEKELPVKKGSWIIAAGVLLVAVILTIIQTLL